jgi:hypothetical protein
MDPMLDIPKGRKTVATGRLCLLLAATALIFLTVLQHLGG